MSETKQLLIKSAIMSGLFIALAPGLVLSIPPVEEADGTKGSMLFSGKVDLRSALVHTGVFFLATAGLFYGAKKYWSDSTIGGALAAQPYARSW